MKALIFYDKIASALATSDLLQSIGPEREIEWEISLWHAGVLRFPSVADEALKQGTDAEMIVFAGSKVNLIRPWTIRWLEQWASTRLIEDAVWALVNDRSTDICSPMDLLVLSEFAGRHDIAFAACGCDIDEISQLVSCDQVLQWCGPQTLGIPIRGSRLRNCFNSFPQERRQRPVNFSCQQAGVPGDSGVF